MAGELVFTIQGTHAVAARPTSLSDAGLRERQHLQEWVLAHPEIIGSDVLVVTTEFDRWISGQGATPLDRLDVLGLDQSGRLVVAELKRDRAPDTVDMQALKYAAMASRFSLDTLASAYSSYLKKREGLETTPSEALTRLQEWAPELSDETLRTPRICLIAGDFPPSVTATTVFLHENGLDIWLLRIQAYRSGQGEVLVTVSQLWPVPNVEDFTISPRSSSSAKQQIARERRRRASIVDRIIAANAVPEGSTLHIVVPAGVKQDVGAIQEWLESGQDRSTATWTGVSPNAIEWRDDGERYTPASLIIEIIYRATGMPPQADVWGPNWFRSGDKTLAQIGEPLPDP
jgi:hypothetical protein